MAVVGATAGVAGAATGAEAVGGPIEITGIAGRERAEAFALTSTVRTTTTGGTTAVLVGVEAGVEATGACRPGT